MRAALSPFLAMGVAVLRIPGRWEGFSGPYSERSRVSMNLPVAFWVSLWGRSEETWPSLEKK